MAVRINAETDRLSRGTSLPPSDGSTIACKIRIATDRNTNSTAWNLSIASGNYVLMETQANGTTWRVWTASDGSNGNTGDIFNASVGEWRYICVSLRANAVDVYYSPAGGGTLTKFTDSANTYTGFTPTHFEIGGISWSAGEFFNGQIAQVMLWNLNLSESAISDQQWSTAPVQLSGLNAWYPMRTAATAILDYSGNNRHLTSAGGTIESELNPPGWSDVIALQSSAIDQPTFDTLEEWTWWLNKASSNPSIINSPIVT